MKQQQFKIKDLPKVDRPREKLISKGLQNLKDEELFLKKQNCDKIKAYDKRKPKKK